MGVGPRAVVAVVLAAAYFATFALRGQWLPGLVGGVLGGVLLFLVLTRMERRRR